MDLHCYELAYCYRLSEAESGNKRGSFPVTIFRQIRERVGGHEFYCFLNGYSRYYYNEIAQED